jgi:DNA-binding XRE family transcriptional regulator
MRHPATPFLVRRARLMMGMTQSEFAAAFDVDDGTVSRWERGKLTPHPSAWRRVREIATCADDTLKASPVIKFLVRMDDLAHPVFVSRGVEEALKSAGIQTREVVHGYDVWRQWVEGHRDFPISAGHALDLVQADPRWLKGTIVYAEAHCISVTLDGEWVNLLVAPIPDREEAVVELAKDRRQDPAQGGFWVRFTTAEDLPRQPLRLS